MPLLTRNSKERCPCGELFVIGFSLDSGAATVLCRRPKGHTGPHSISKMNYADVLEDGHSPAPVDAEPKEKRWMRLPPRHKNDDISIHREDDWCKKAGCRPASQCEIDAAVAGSETHPVAPAPAEGAEQFWDRKYGSPDSLTKGSVKAVACEFAEAYAAALREQAQFEVEALKGNVKDWRKAYEDVQRELEEAFKVVQGYQVQHNVICSVESHNKITECPCENCIAARALARSTEEAKK